MPILTGLLCLAVACRIIQFILGGKKPDKENEDDDINGDDFINSN
jgi:hypothetical protein